MSPSSSSVGSRLRGWAEAIRRDVMALYLAARDPRVPWFAKLVAGAVLAYALSPIDLIPDFIPVLGYVDDLIILPLGIMLAIRLIPPAVMDEHRATATSAGETPRSLTGAVMVVVIWLAVVALLTWWVASAI